MASSLLLGLVLISFNGDPIVVPPPTPIAGVVVDISDRPVGNAEIYLVGDLTGGASKTLWQGRSDGQGKFEAPRTKGIVEGPPFLSSTHLTLFAYRAGDCLALAEVTIRQQTTDDPVRLVLRPSAGISVRVVAPDRTPVRGARVKVSEWVGYRRLSEDLSEKLAAETDEGGHARLVAFAPEDIRWLKVSTPDHGVQLASLSSNTEPEFLVILSPVGRLRGRILAGRGQDAAGIIVRGGSAPSIPGLPDHVQGTFEAISDATGRLEVPALAAGRLSLFYFRNSRSIGTSATRGLTTRRIDSGKPTDIEISMRQGLPMRGLVRDRETGAPIAGALISVGDPFDFGAMVVRTDGTGHYEAVLGPGRVRFRVIDAGAYRRPERSDQEIATIEEIAEPVELPPVDLIRGASVRGFVFDESGKPVAGANVEAVGIDGEVISRESGFTRVLKTNQRGEFLLENVLPDAPIEFWASRGEAASGPPESRLPSAARPITLVISPLNTMSLAGRVVDEHGKPIAKARVRVDSSSKTSAGVEVLRFPAEIGKWDIRTDADGRFQTPRELLRYQEQRFSATAEGKQSSRTEWFAPTTPSFFSLALFPVYPAEQDRIRKSIEAAYQSYVHGDFAEAEARYTAAIAEDSEHSLQDPLALSGCYLGLARAQLALKQFDKCAVAAKAALKLRKKVLKTAHPAVADAMYEFANALSGQGRNDEAEALHRNALAIREQAEGPEDPDFARGLTAFGLFLESQTRDDEAEANLSRAIVVLEKTRGREHPDLIYPLAFRARTLTRAGRLEEAESDFRRALAVTEKTIGIRHQFAAVVISNLADFLRKTGREDEAKALEGRMPRPNR